MFCFPCIMPGPAPGTLDLLPECHQHQADASHLHPRCGGHDTPRWPQWSWNSPQPAHQIQRKTNICEYYYTSVLLLLMHRYCVTVIYFHNMFIQTTYLCLYYACTMKPFPPVDIMLTKKIQYSHNVNFIWTQFRLTIYDKSYMTSQNFT